MPDYSERDFSVQETRALRIVDSVCLVGALLLLFHLAVLVTMNIFVWENDVAIWRGGVLRQFGITVALLFVMHATRFGYLVKVYAFFAWIILFVLNYTFEHRAAGDQFLLYAAPCVTVFFLGTRRKLEAIVLSFLAYFLAFHINVLIPLDVSSRDFSFHDLWQEFLWFWGAANFSDFTWVLVILSTGAVMFVATYFAYAQVEKSEAALAREHARSEMLLKSLLPDTVAKRLKDDPDGQVADEFSEVTILFADIVGFTSMASRKKPSEVVALLNSVFSEFDKLAEKHGLEKIKTIGDEYMVASGMPDKRDDHAKALADMAIDMMDVVERQNHSGEAISLRIGLHVGPAVAGVIGKSKPYYDVWGDTINIASRMQATGEAGRIQITPELKEKLAHGYQFQERGKVDVKGKGTISSYFLIGKDSATDIV